MKKSKSAELFAVFFLVLAILFNPDKEDFNKKIHSISTENSNITYEEAKLFGMDKIYESGYSRQNYYIFSIYKTNGSTNSLWTQEEYKGKDITYIGLFRIFVKMN